jgi:CubicO group peptidase (beta-lactamase class C family)
MSPSKLSVAGLQTYVSDLVAAGHAPAVSIAVWREDQVHEAAAGVLSVETSAEATTSSLFMIGSITKVFTASLIMRLADEGRLDLDIPIKQYLRDFHVGDSEAVQKITARQLLSHTSGLETDIYPDDLWDQGNVIARYVDRCFLLPQVHKEFGTKYSYSNVGYVVAGRLAEVASGMSWAQAIDEYIYRPLGMRFAVSSPLQLPRYSAATGHLYTTQSEWSVARDFYRPRGVAPAGSVLAMSASDLLKFGRAHLHEGRLATGKQWLSPASVKVMREPQVRLPARTSLFETNWGVGWGLGDCEGLQWFGHGGGRVGYQALLAVVPQHDAILSVQANGMKLGGAPLLRKVLSDWLSESCGTGLAVTPPEMRARELTPFAGKYGAAGFKFDIRQATDHLAAEFVLDGQSTEKVHFKLMPTASDSFAVYSQTGEYWDEVVFLEPDDRGIPKYLFFGNRLNARLSD